MRTGAHGTVCADAHRIATGAESSGASGRRFHPWAVGEVFGPDGATALPAGAVADARSFSPAASTRARTTARRAAIAVTATAWGRWGRWSMCMRFTSSVALFVTVLNRLRRGSRQLAVRRARRGSPRRGACPGRAARSAARARRSARSARQHHAGIARGRQGRSGRARPSARVR